jgi:hypothetical protein
MHAFQIHLQSQLKFLLLYSSFSHNMFRPYGSSSGEIYNITYTIEVPSLLQRIRCSLIVYLRDVSPLISIYSFNYLNFSLN